MTQNRCQMAVEGACDVRLKRHLFVFVLLIGLSLVVLLTSTAMAQKTGLHAVNFFDFDYPSDCWKANPNSGFEKTIRVANGEWKRGSEGSEIYFHVEKPVFAEVVGGSGDDAVVTSSCGFTTGDDWDTEIFVFHMLAGKAVLIKRFSSPDWADSSLGPMWRVANDGVRAKKGEVDVTYYAGGSHAQPQWLATARFRWNGKRFVRFAVDRKPFTP